MPKKNQLFYLRARRTEKEYLVSACDENVLGETLSEGEIEIYVNERFFGGELVSIEKCLEELRKASSFTIFGTEIVNEAVKHRLVNELSVHWIDCTKNGRVGHAMLIR
ncbi:MAG: DUF424 domain-containing protein [Candidatus Heimdallarchaeota archaeon]